MAQCKRCERSGLLFRTSPQGLCRPCEEEILARVEEERERVKEALIWVRCNTSPEDKLLHLHRAMDGVRALKRYERLGCNSTRPSPSELAEILRRKVEEVRDEQATPRGKPLPAGGPPSGQPDEGLGLRKGEDVAARAWDRRRTARQPARFAVSVLGDGVRGRAEDVSAHGVRFRSPVAHRSGSRVHLRFETPAGAVTTVGVVRWAERPPSGAPLPEPGAMGLEWTEIPEALRGYLEDRAGGRRAGG